jgi:tetratricopeptide (TPR) repeat protein
VAGRNLSWAEWQQFMADQPYQATCPEVPLHLAALYRQADSYTQAGEVRQAEETWSQAVQAALETEVPSLNNSVCWFGSLNGFATIVLPACERAVELGTETNQGFYRDSRGLARALLGDYQGAIKDFEFFVDWAAEYQPEGNLALKRQLWISELKAGHNPFEGTILATLRDENFDSSQ